VAQVAEVQAAQVAVVQAAQAAVVQVAQVAVGVVAEVAVVAANNLKQKKILGICISTFQPRSDKTVLRTNKIKNRAIEYLLYFKSFRVVNTALSFVSFAKSRKRFSA
jgi:hypothetical protein